MEDLLTSKVIGLAIDVHRDLGPGLLERVYQNCLAYELEKAGIEFEYEKTVPLKYKELSIDCAYRLDFLVEKKLVLELKTVEKITKDHEAQMLTYMKLTDSRLGLLFNFNKKLLKEGIKRFIL